MIEVDIDEILMKTVLYPRTIPWIRSGKSIDHGWECRHKQCEHVYHRTWQGWDICQSCHYPLSLLTEVSACSHQCGILSTWLNNISSVIYCSRIHPQTYPYSTVRVISNVLVCFDFSLHRLFNLNLNFTQLIQCQYNEIEFKDTTKHI